MPVKSKSSYAATKKYRNNNPEKYYAHREVRYAIRRGDIVRQPCEQCGDLKSDAHHDDYSLVFSIRWMCQKHHKQYHKSIRKN